MATVLITGANRGIGLALARAFAGRGDEVIGVCRASSPELEATGARVIAGIDVGDDACEAKLRAAVDRSIDVAVLNAGVLVPDNLDRLDFAEARRTYDINALGPLRCTRAIRGRLHAGSKIAIITSRVGSIGDNGSGSLYAYRMSKAAVNMAGVNLAIELRPAGIAVGLLHPGMVATDMTHHGIPPEESANNLVARIDELTMATSGRFFHANGEALPW